MATSDFTVGGIDVVLPAKAKDCMHCGVGTRFYQEGVEIKDVSSFAMPTTGAEGILMVTITVPLKSITYSEK